MDGLTVSRRIREVSDTPILMLSAQAITEDDIIDGLNAGADEYLAKPVRLNEFVARVAAMLRRASMTNVQTEQRYDDGHLNIDLRRRQVYVNGVNVHLTPTEFKLLHFLVTHPERVHSRKQLLDRVWGDHVFIEERTVDVHVKRLRDALAPARCASMVETVRGVGYRLVKPSTSLVTP
jgi:two-component system phosphate regulon response regulator PhoB